MFELSTSKVLKQKESIPFAFFPLALVSMKQTDPSLPSKYDFSR